MEEKIESHGRGGTRGSVEGRPRGQQKEEKWKEWKS